MNAKMKIWALVAAAIVASVTTTSSNSSKGWNQMNGHERYNYLVAYRSSNKLVCRGLEGRSRAQDEQSLNQPIPYSLVLMYIGIYCRKDTGATILAQAKTKIPKTVPKRQVATRVSPPVRAATAPSQQKTASVAPKQKAVRQAQAAQKPIEKKLASEPLIPESQQTAYVLQASGATTAPQQKTVGEAQAAPKKPIVKETAPESLVPESQQTAYVDQPPGVEYQLETAGPSNDPLRELHFKRVSRRYSTALHSDECR